MIELCWGDEFIEYYGDCRRTIRRKKKTAPLSAIVGQWDRAQRMKAERKRRKAKATKRSPPAVKDRKRS